MATMFNAASIDGEEANGRPVLSTSFDIAALCRTHTGPTSLPCDERDLRDLPKLWPAAVKEGAQAFSCLGASSKGGPADALPDLLLSMQRFELGCMPYTLLASRKLFKWICDLSLRCRKFENQGIEIQPKSPCTACESWGDFTEALLDIKETCCVYTNLVRCGLPGGSPLEPLRDNLTTSYPGRALHFATHAEIVVAEVSLWVYTRTVHRKQTFSQWVARVHYHAYNATEGRSEQGDVQVYTYARDCVRSAFYEEVLRLWPDSAIQYYDMRGAHTWDYAVKCPFLAEAMIYKYGEEAMEHAQNDIELQVNALL